MNRQWLATRKSWFNTRTHWRNRTGLDRNETLLYPDTLTSAGFPSVAATQELSFLRKSSEKRLPAKLVWTSTKGIVGPLVLLVLEQKLQERWRGDTFRYSRLPADVTSKYTCLGPDQSNLVHKKCWIQDVCIYCVWRIFNNCVTSGTKELLLLVLCCRDCIFFKWFYFERNARILRLTGQSNISHSVWSAKPPSALRWWFGWLWLLQLKGTWFSFWHSQCANCCVDQIMVK